MPAQLLDLMLSGQGLLLLLVFGIAPGLILRVALLAYPRAHPDRAELLGEYYAVPYHERPLFVAAGCERALCDGLSARVRELRERRAALPVQHAGVVNDSASASDTAVATVTASTTVCVDMKAETTLTVGRSITLGGGLSSASTLGGGSLRPAFESTEGYGTPPTKDEGDEE